MKTKTAIKCLIILIIFFPASLCAADSVDNSAYDEILKKYVRNGLVDYKGFKREEKKLDQYLKVLENIKETRFMSAEYLNGLNRILIITP